MIALGSLNCGCAGGAAVPAGVGVAGTAVLAPPEGAAGAFGAAGVAAGADAGAGVDGTLAAGAAAAGAGFG